MSWLAKRLSLLFFLIAIILILLVTIISQFDLVTILQRILIGGLIFGLLGGVIGQLISYNLDRKRRKPNNKAKQQQASTKGTAKEESSTVEEDMEPLDFDSVNEAEENVVNMAQEAPDQVADMVKNMNQED